MMNILAFLMPHAGWLTDLTQWLLRQIQRFWDALVAFFNDLLILAIQTMLALMIKMIGALPVPDFLKNYSIGTLLGNAGSTVGWFVQTFKLGECLALIGSAVAFRILRKVMTMGKW